MPLRENEIKRMDKRINSKLPELKDMSGWNVFVEDDHVPPPRAPELARQQHL